MRDLKNNVPDSKHEMNDKNVSPGDWVVVITHTGDTFQGTLMPRYASMDKKHVVLKLKSGYNLGISSSKVKSVSKSGHDLGLATNLVDDAKPRLQIWKENVQPVHKIALIGTGGTIASKVDYRTGGVSAALSASEIYDAVPELRKHASIEADFMFNEYSENLEPHHWTLIANRIAEKVRSGGFRGIVVSHGTDTMHYTAAALSFALHNLPIPVVLVGSQRSSDRPSSDAALNLLGATIFSIESPYTGVFIAMHGSTSDDFISCHLGTRVRKNHTSRRDAFESIDRLPIATVKNAVLKIQSQFVKMEIPKRSYNDDAVISEGLENNFEVESKFDPRVTLIKYYPGLDPNLIAYEVKTGSRAIVLEGTGLGHVGRKFFPEIAKAIKSGVLIFMTSQCIWGRTNMKVYDTGRDLIELGVVPLEDMTPETAVVKAMWVMANSHDNAEAVRMMGKNIANEISLTSPISMRLLNYGED
ncbi:MAG: Glu-tRNA(Gln) amidotransferase subunit GatD [Nitrososphaeraceae archaeon]|nr:Glu-tRNA(Gln) amidotransferase subunit GatD [Nitrososphaeraceae archaeon]